MGKGEHSDRRIGKKEVNFFGQEKETHERKLDEMNNLVKNISEKLARLDLEDKNPP